MTTPTLREVRYPPDLPVSQRKDDIAARITDEHGKVLSDAAGEVQRGLEVVEFACGIPQLLKGEYSDQISSDVDSFSFRQPLGVCVGITPFNFPMMVPLWMHPLAIATGNTFVLKPSERDPSASNLVAELYAARGAERWGRQRLDRARGRLSGNRHRDVVLGRRILVDHDHVDRAV